MIIREYEGFQVQIHSKGAGYFAEIYHKEKLLKSIHDDQGNRALLFSGSMLALEAAKEWIDRMYSKRIRFKGYI